MKNFFSLKRGARKGFTLVELLVSITVFVIFLGIASQSYVNIVRTQRQANEVRKMYSEVRQFMDLLTEEIRLSSIDYFCYEPGATQDFDATTVICDPDIALNPITNSGMTKVLALVRKGGLQKTVFKVTPSRDDSSREIVQVKRYERIAGTWQQVAGFLEESSLLSDNIEIENLTFSIFPNRNPYSDDIEIIRDTSYQFQPKVTVFLSVKNAEEITVPFSGDFQTTVSSRVYSRKL